MECLNGCFTIVSLIRLIIPVPMAYNMYSFHWRTTHRHACEATMCQAGQLKILKLPFCPSSIDLPPLLSSPNDCGSVLSCCQSPGPIELTAVAGELLFGSIPTSSSHGLHRRRCICICCCQLTIANLHSHPPCHRRWFPLLAISLVPSALGWPCWTWPGSGHNLTWPIYPPDQPCSGYLDQLDNFCLVFTVFEWFEVYFSSL